MILTSLKVVLAIDHFNLRFLLATFAWPIRLSCFEGGYFGIRLLDREEKVHLVKVDEPVVVSHRHH